MSTQYCDNWLVVFEILHNFQRLEQVANAIIYLYYDHLSNLIIILQDFA